MKWRLVITGEGPALNDPPQPNDANNSASGIVELLQQVPGQKITAATFQVDANNVNLLKKPKAPAAPEPPSPPVVV